MATATRSNNEPMSNIVLWTPKHGRRKPGRPAITYTDILKIVKGLESADFMSAMGDRKAWGTIVVRGLHSTYKHTDRNVELKTKGSFQNHPTHYRKPFHIVFPPCKVSNPTIPVLFFTQILQTNIHGGKWTWVTNTVWVVSPSRYHRTAVVIINKNRYC